MKHKLQKLSRWSFALALGIFLFSYFLFHYTAPDGAFTAVYQTEPGKPFVTLLFSVLGVLFLFSSIMSALIVRVFCREEQKLEHTIRRVCNQICDSSMEAASIKMTQAQELPH